MSEADRYLTLGDGSEVRCQMTSTNFSGEAVRCTLPAGHDEPCGGRRGGMWAAASVGDLPQDVAWQEGLLEGFDPYTDEYDADGEL